MSKKRDSAYWRGRIEREFPEIAARLNAGEITSVRAAAIVAGLIRERTPLMDLRRAWSRAGDDERRAFAAETGATLGGPEPAPEPASEPAPESAPESVSEPKPEPAPDSTPGPMPDSIPAMVREIARIMTSVDDQVDDPDEVARNYIAPVQRHIQRFVQDTGFWLEEMGEDIDADARAALGAPLDRLKALVED